MPPSAALLRERLTGRGTESEDVIASRLARAVQEAEGIEEYDYLVINDDLDTCIRELHGIIQSEHCSVERNQEIIGQMRRELKAFE